MVSLWVATPPMDPRVAFYIGPTTYFMRNDSINDLLRRLFGSLLGASSPIRERLWCQTSHINIGPLAYTDIGHSGEQYETASGKMSVLTAKQSKRYKTALDAREQYTARPDRDGGGGCGYSTARKLEKVE